MFSNLICTTERFFIAFSMLFPKYEVKIKKKNKKIMGT